MLSGAKGAFANERLANSVRVITIPSNQGNSSWVFFLRLGNSCKFLVSNVYVETDTRLAPGASTFPSGYPSEASAMRILGPPIVRTPESAARIDSRNWAVAEEHPPFGEPRVGSSGARGIDR